VRRRGTIGRDDVANEVAAVLWGGAVIHGCRRLRGSAQVRTPIRLSAKSRRLGQAEGALFENGGRVQGRSPPPTRPPGATGTPGCRCGATGVRSGGGVRSAATPFPALPPAGAANAPPIAPIGEVAATARIVMLSKEKLA